MSIKDRVTGITGGAVGDSMSRGLVVAALQGVLAFISVRVDALTQDDLVILLPVTTTVGYLLWGAYDKWIRVRLPSA
jgi:hypothetical protein